MIIVCYSLKTAAARFGTPHSDTAANVRIRSKKQKKNDENVWNDEIGVRFCR